MFSRAKEGRRRARECFQIAPSLEKIELPRRGMKVARRACVDVNLGFGVVVHGVVLFFFKMDLPVLSRIPREQRSAAVVCRDTHLILTENCVASNACMFAGSLVKTMGLPSTIYQNRRQGSATQTQQIGTLQTRALTVFFNVCTSPFKFSSKISSRMSSSEESARLHRTCLWLAKRISIEDRFLFI